jgi:hypothetical protein
LGVHTETVLKSLHAEFQIEAVPFHGTQEIPNTFQIFGQTSSILSEGAQPVSLEIAVKNTQTRHQHQTK